MKKFNYVPIPKDLSRVKRKIAFGLTKRQLICFSIAAVIGLPFYFLARKLIGNSNAATAMVLIMLPAFLFAMYEKDGLPLEKVLMNYIGVRYLRPQIRVYDTSRARAAIQAVEKEKAEAALKHKEGGDAGGQKEIEKEGKEGSEEGGKAAGQERS